MPARPSSLGAPPGTHAVVIRAGGLEVPIIGSVNGPTGKLEASTAERLRRARAALQALESRQFRKW
jgi:hypothetical protein